MVKRSICTFFSILITLFFTTNTNADFSSTTHWNSTSEEGWGCTNYQGPGGSWPGNHGLIDGSISTPDPSNSLRVVYPKGWPNGYVPYECWNTFGPFDEVWLEFYFRLSDNFFLHPVLQKLIYDWIGPDSKANHFIYVRGSWKMGLQMQGGESRNYWSNTGYDPIISRGTWYKVRAHYVINTPGIANGEFQMWINDKKVMDYNTVTWRSSSDSGKGFYKFDLAPVFGGNVEGLTKPAEDYISYDLMTISATGEMPAGGKIPESATGIKIE